MRRGIGRLRAGGGVGGPPTANMAAWFRKGIGQSDAGAGALSAWADQSGNGRNYAQATGAAQPTIQAGGTVLFDGTGDYLKTAGFTLNQPFTRYLRVKQVTWTLNDYLCDGLTSNTGALIQTSASPNIGLLAGVTVAANSALAVGAWGSVAAVFNGASSVLSINGTETTGDPGAGNPGGLTLGGWGGVGSFGNIEVAEEIVYSVAHDAATRASVLAYLNTL